MRDSSVANSVDSSLLPVCIIGAGSSGVTKAKALRQKGVAFECFEIGSDIGGMWRYENDNGLSSAYRSLHIDTSRNNLCYSDFPIADHYPDFLSHVEVLEPLEAYAEKFAVRPHIRFNTRVDDVRPGAQGGWQVRLQDGEVRRYRAVLVANGHLWDPRWPDFPGHFNGLAIHSHDYCTADPFKDKHVLIVGIGNSAVDIAVDVCRQAKSTTLSTRRSAWIMPKYIMGIPVDRWSGFMSRKLKFPTRLTPTIPLVEIQARWVAAVLSGETTLPGEVAMREEIARHNAELAKRYVGSARYTLEVNFGDYARQLRRDMARPRAAGSGRSRSVTQGQ